MPSFPLSFNLSPMPTGLALDANGFGQQLVQNLGAVISGNFLTGQIGGSQPTSNIGPWLNGSQWWFWDPTSNQYLVQTFTAESAGVIKLYGGSSPPSGYLLCDGSLYLRSSYPGLFGVIGGTYNNGDGVSTFGVPDYRGRVPVGTGTGSGLTARSIGQSFGEEKHVLVIGELASHNHGVSDPTHAHATVAHSHSASDSGHTHTYTATNTTISALTSGGSFFATVQSSPTNNTGTGFASISIGSAAPNTYGAGTGIGIQNTGSGTGHNNIQPSLVCNYIIKT